MCARILGNTFYTKDVDPNSLRNKISLMLLYIRAKCAKNMSNVAKVVESNSAQVKDIAECPSPDAQSG